MIREIANAIKACLLTFVVCAVAYPAAVWGLGQLAFPEQAEGSLIERDGKVVGSALIAQPFASDKYFQPRPSAAGSSGYAADAASGSNLGTKNPALKDRMILDVAKQIAAHDNDTALKAKLDELDKAQGELKTKNDLKEKTKADTDAIAKLEEQVAKTKSEIRIDLEHRTNIKHLVPVDLVTTSGAGLDPDISLEGARYQAPRVASARGFSIEKVNALIDAHANRSGAIIGAPERINVLQLNLALDDEKPAPKTASKPAVVEPVEMKTSPEPKPTPAAPEDAFTALSKRVDALQKQLDTVPITNLTSELNDVKSRVVKLASNASEAAVPVKTIGRLETQVATLDREVQGVRAELKTVRDSSKIDNIATLLDQRSRAFRSEIDSLRDAMKKVQTTLTETKAPKHDIDLAPAIKLFQSKRFAEASTAFRTLAQTHPDDARVWYYAALSHGLTTGQWRGETEDLVNKGVERERGGTPTAGEIDSALGGLSKDTGQEWLAFYRQRVTIR